MELRYNKYNKFVFRYSTFKYMFSLKCIVCEKKIEMLQVIEKHEVFFCGEECLTVYEEKLVKLKEIVDWDNCC